MSDRCRGCNKKLIWAAMDGKRIPLDASAPVYVRLGDGSFARHSDAYVSHFSTCPNADQFSSAKKATADA